MESIFKTLSLEAPYFPQNRTMWAASVQAWSSMSGLHALFALCWELHSWQLCFWFSAAHPIVSASALTCHLFFWGDWIAPICSEPFGPYYCHSIKSFASPSSIIYLRLFTNLHFLLNPVLAFCWDTSPTNVMLFSLILLSWIAAQQNNTFLLYVPLETLCSIAYQTPNNLVWLGNKTLGKSCSFNSSVNAQVTCSH